MNKPVNYIFPSMVGEKLRSLRLTHVINEERTWDRVRRHQMEPWHRYYWSDEAHSWHARGSGAPVPDEEVGAWAAEKGIPDD